MSNLYLVYGDEGFLVDQKVKEIQTAFLGKNFDASHVEVIDGERASLSDIVYQITSVSMFSPQKVFLIKNLQGKGSRRKKQKEKSSDFSILEDALGLIPQETCVIFIYNSAKLEAGSVYSMLEGAVECFEFKSFSEWQKDEVLSHVLALVKAAGGNIKKDVAFYLIDLVGNDLRTLNSEIQKLVNYKGSGQTIDKADIDALVSPGSIGIFKLMTYLKQKDLRQTLNGYQKLRKFGEDPFSVLAMIGSTFRMMFQVKLLAGKLRDPFAIAKNLGSSPYYVKQILKEVNNFDLLELKDILLKVYGADTKIKTGFDKDAAMEILLSEICQDRNRIKLGSR
ncbi:MAG: DNA polymerase III subunit delta [Candidatus Margulisbacteria bacterium]|nr:DNA polymerase III subunit delta [Candidatus Margulisiibacteriota bacterium]